MDLSTYSALAPWLCSLIWFRAIRTKNPPLLVLLSITVVVETIASVLYYYKASNIGLYSVFTVVEFALLTASLQRLQYQKVPVAITGTLILVNLACAILDYGYINGPNLYNSFSRIIAGISIIGLSLYAFYDLLRHPLTDKFLGQSALFWLALAILIYTSGNLFMFAVNNLLYTQHHPAHSLTWILHSILNILFNILLTKSVLCLKEK